MAPALLPTPRCNPSRRYRSVFYSTYGGTKEGGGLDDVRNLQILLLPLPEHYTIVTLLDRETAKLDAIIAKTHEQPGKLQEHRTARISAAVTGKIVVREMG